MKIFYYLSIVLVVFFANLNCQAKDKDFLKIFNLIKQQKWQELNLLSKKISDSALKKVILSQQYMDENYAQNSFEDITKFLAQNPRWPQNYGLKIRAENLLNSTTDKQAILSWFNKNAPITAQGYKYYALATASLAKDAKDFKSIIKSGWVFGSFTDCEQELYYKDFGKYLTIDDHVKKIDNYLWKDQVTCAKNFLNYVNDGYKKSFKAQIAFIQNNKDARKLFKHVPKKYYTSGLIYRYLCSRKQNLPSASEIVDLSRIASSDAFRADSFWKIQSYLAREFIEQKKYNEAYKAASGVFTSNPSLKSEAEYFLGWIALSFLHKPDLAIGHFRNFNRSVETPISKARAIYWLARTYEDKKNIEKSQKLYHLAADKYPYTFYGQIAAIELDKNIIAMPAPVNLGKHKEKMDSYVKNNEITRAAQIVSKYGGNALSQTYITSAIAQAQNTYDIYSVIGAIAESKNIHHTTWAAKTAIQKHVVVRNHAFPTPYELDQLPIEAPLMYSIIRQESVFDQHAISSAKAMGLMQLVKSTACSTAKLVGVECITSKLTADKNYNILLGTNHIRDLIKERSGSYILTIASYNTASRNVNRWIKIFGDPRTLTNHREVIDWLEQIPFHETRNYVQRVLENLQIYRVILNKNGNFKMLDDLLSNSGQIAKAY
jgi:soluble lytic murein transglycosylase